VDAAGNSSAKVSGVAAPLVNGIDGFIVTSAVIVPEGAEVQRADRVAGVQDRMSAEA